MFSIFKAFSDTPRIIKLYKYEVIHLEVMSNRSGLLQATKVCVRACVCVHVLIINILDASLHLPVQVGRASRGATRGTSTQEFVCFSSIM